MRRGALGAERLLEAARGVLGDILVERAGYRARLEDALDGAVLERTEPRGVREGGVEIRGRVACAQDEDDTRLVAPDPRRPRAEQPEERRPARPQTVEDGSELIEIHGALAARRRVQALGIELEAGAARRELVTRDARQVGGVDEQLALGDADGQEVGDVVVGDRKSVV